MAALLLALCACGSSSAPLADAGSDAGSDAGPVDSGPSWSAPVTIDSSPDAGFELTWALDAQGKPAIAYFRDDAPNQDELIVARETAPGVWSSESVPAGPDGGTLAGHYGLGLAFDPMGNPAVAYLGGETRDSKQPPDERWHDFNTGVPLPSDAMMARKSGGAWTQTTLGNASDSYVHTGFAVDDQGGIVGLWSALAFDSSGVAHVVQRDVHFASAEADTDASNLEYAQFSGGAMVTGEAITSRVSGDPSGNPPSYTNAPAACVYPPPTMTPPPACYIHGGGTYSHLVIYDGQPAVAFAQSPDTVSDADGAWFATRNADGSWNRAQVTATTGSPGNGPSLAFSSASGFALGIHDSFNGDLLVATSPDGINWNVNTVEALGDTGYHPAVAFGHLGLGVLYGYCRAPTDPSGACNPSVEELRFRLPGSNGPGGVWLAPEHVDAEVPDQAVLIADGNGDYLAVWRDPLLGVRASRRTP